MDENETEQQQASNESTIPQDTVSRPGRSKILAQKQSPFFRLPTELRLKFYESFLKLPDDGEAIVLRYHPRSQGSCTNLNLLLVCRRILAEAEHLFYHLNRFNADNTRWLSSLSHRRQGFVTQLELNTCSPSKLMHDLRYLSNARNLKTLYVRREVSIRSENVPEWCRVGREIVMEMWERLPSLRKVVILGPTRDNRWKLDRVESDRLSRLDALGRKMTEALETGELWTGPVYPRWKSVQQ